MILNLIDQRIRRLFSNAAIQYDVLTGLHKEIGRELVKTIENHATAKHILDIGMGTGWLTNRLKYYFPDAVVVGLDFAPGMIAVAKKNKEGIYLIEADALALPLKEESFDIIVSNLAYQWVSNPTQAFDLCQRTLKKGGVLSFTMFGEMTLHEMFSSLTNTMQENEKRLLGSFTRLSSQEEVVAILNSIGFEKVRTDYERIKVHFPDMMSLLKWVKSIGASALRHDLYVGKEWLKRAEGYYTQHFRDRLGIYATFEVIWAKAEK